jgi:hypothetical protein
MTAVHSLFGYWWFIVVILYTKKKVSTPMFFW